ncbi:MAG: MarR family winged helix-turn-helix transcriptional regulator [Gordonia sp. (in: high G+C Gram-positive bacteria)]
MTTNARSVDAGVSDATTGSDLPGDSDSRRFAAALTRMETYRRHRRQNDSIGAAEMRLLWLLAESGPLTLAEVTSALGLERSTVNRQVNGAVDAGLLGKERVAGSSAFQVFLTDHGRDAFDRTARRALAVIGDTLAEMGSDDSAALIDLVERFVDAYGRRTCALAEAEDDV